MDYISRQDAIDVLRTCYDTEIKEYDDGSDWINYDDAVCMIEELPPAQPETIKCYDCMWCGHDNDKTFCDHPKGLVGWVGPTDFCSRAKRRTDERQT